MATGRVGDLNVPDLSDVGTDRARDIPFHQLHVVAIVLVPQVRRTDTGKECLLEAEGDRGLARGRLSSGGKVGKGDFYTNAPLRASVAQTYHKERRSSCLARLRRTWNRPVILLLCLGVAIEQLTTHFRRARSVSGETKTPIVVVVIGVVVVAVGATRIRSSVVPRAAAQHIVGQFLFVIIH